MTKIDIAITDLESILTNCRNKHTQEELDWMQTRLDLYRTAVDLRDQFLERAVVENNALTQTLELQHTDEKPIKIEFAPGTAVYYIRLWFEAMFGVDADELFEPNTSEPEPDRAAASAFILVETKFHSDGAYDIRKPKLFPTRAAAEDAMVSALHKRSGIDKGTLRQYVGKNPAPALTEKYVGIDRNGAYYTNCGVRSAWRIFEMEPMSN